MAQPKRAQNKCKDCGYTWHPRGKNLSLICPSCNSKKVGYAGTGLLGLIGLGAVYFFLQLSSGSGVKPVEAQVDTGPAGVSVESLVNKSEPFVATQTPSPIREIAPPSASNRQSLPVVPIDPGPTPDLGKVEVVEKIYSDDEIDEMENAKQYHGDDSIVRARLGLPSRETRKLLP